MTSKQLSFAIVLILILAFNLMLMHELVDAQNAAQECECVCEPAPALVLPDDTPTVQEWLQWME